ncbi:MAG: M14 family metallopeptidase [Bacteroidales bacterium]|nr:M14 family metallopeptidase [Bacteroidales bacterium]
MKKVFVTLALALTAVSALAGVRNIPQEWMTLAEKTDFRKTPRFDETMDFFRRLADKSSMVSFSSFGMSPQGRELNLVIVDKDGLTTPEQIRAKGRVIVLVQSCIHSGEPDGKDASMIWLRDMILSGKDKALLSDVSFLMIPIFNVDGHEDFRATNRINQNGPDELGTRNTAQLLNLNRDFLKADSPEMKAWLRLYSAWEPELFIDCHVTNGADFQYVMTYDIENHGSAMAEPLHSFSKEVFERELNEKMAAAGFPMFPYCEYERTYAPELGASLDVFDPRYSQSYAAYRNRLGLLLETHIYKPYKSRVMATLESIRQCAYILKEHKKELQKSIAEADKATASDAFREQPFPLKYEIDKSIVTYVDYLGWQRDTVKSDLSGGMWVKHNYDKPFTYNVPLYQSQKVAYAVRVPKAYVLMPQYSYLTELLDLHGIRYEVAAEAAELEVETYRYTEGRFSTRQREGRVPLVACAYTTQTERLTCPKGSIIIDMAQPKAKLAIYLFEPDAPGSLTYWGFFNAHVQSDNEFWVNPAYMEFKGREMLQENPAIKAEFDARMQDPEFAGSPDKILGFFYAICRKQSHQDNELHPVWRVLRNSRP